MSAAATILSPKTNLVVHFCAMGLAPRVPRPKALRAHRRWQQVSGICSFGPSANSVFGMLLLAIVAAGFAPTDAQAQPPRVVNPVEDLTLTVGTGRYRVDLRDTYYGILERCEAVSSDTGVATVVIVNGYDLYVDPVGVGMADITIVTENEYGSTEHDFQVTVNHAPPPRGHWRIPGIRNAGGR